MLDVIMETAVVLIIFIGSLLLGITGYSMVRLVS